MKHRKWIRIGTGLFVVVVVLLVLLTSLRILKLPLKEKAPKGRVPVEEFLNLDAAVAYTGDDKCAVCHEAIYRSFVETGMGRSFYRPSTNPVKEDFSEPARVSDTTKGFIYEVIKEDAVLYQVEFRQNENGERIHELKRRVDYVVGSGRGTRSFITEDDGFLYELPVTWYSQRGIWDLSPGYHTTNFRFSRPIVPQCMHCHNSFAKYVEFSENRYREVPLGIGCERCHGPGELHVEWRLSQESDRHRGRDSTIVNPARLPLDLQLDVCGQCHLQGELSVFKPGHTTTSFRPGMALSEVKSVFIRSGLPTGDFRIASHGARISLSACYTQTGGELVCTTCHNPHVSVSRVPRQRFNDRCLECHQAAFLSPVTPTVDHRPEGNCVACHMPQGATSDILHVNFTDHWIRKEIEALNPGESHSLLALKPAVPIVLENFFDEEGSGADISLGIAYVKFFESRHGHPDYLKTAIELLETGLESRRDHHDGRYYLGVAYLHLGRLEAAREAFEMVVEIAPEDAYAYFQLGSVRLNVGDPHGASRAFKAALAIAPDHPKSWKMLGDTYLELGMIDDASRAYERAVEILPGFAVAHNALGELLAYRFDEVSKAGAYFDRAVHLEPDFPRAIHNLGNVYLVEGEEDRALELFHKVVSLDPGFGPAHGSLASIYERRGERQKTLFHLNRLLAIQPENEEARAMLTRLR